MSLRLCLETLVFSFDHDSGSERAGRGFLRGQNWHGCLLVSSVGLIHGRQSP